MWSHHENTILNAIARQLTEDNNPPDDREELLHFLGSLTKGGDRAMVDLCDLAGKAYFHPDTKGSSSIKKVLPAILKGSELLKTKYRRPDLRSAWRDDRASTSHRQRGSRGSMSLPTVRCRIRMTG